MVFSSIEFLFYFLPIFLIVFYLTGLRKGCILAFSLLFYSWGEPFYILLMLLSIVVNHQIGLAIEEGLATGHARQFLVVGIILNLLPLICFKYLNFLVGNVGDIFGFSAKSIGLPQLVMPLGISFYTFHAMSYLIDVYRKDVPPERSLIDLTIYMSMFPQLIAGPIIRYKTIATELHAPDITAARTALGIRLFLIGLSQKVLIANTVATTADGIFALPADQLTPPLAWLGIAAYTIQIYFDFAGYSTMALGLGLLIGFTFPLNFNYPYAAISMTEFWRRWHISLSSWFRDYLYISLGGNRGSAASTYRNLIIVFVLCGIWHGAAWTFLVWGLLHGSFLIIERVGLARVLERLPALARHAYVILAVMVTWVFFRADSLHGAITYLAAMIGQGGHSPVTPTVIRFFTPDVALALLVGAVISMPVVPWLKVWIEERQTMWPSSASQSMLETTYLASLAVFAVLSAASLAGGAYNPFIYFRF